ncbi:hypothetical protein NQD34_000071 [Periophthalmus magnuspinnatus]|nr:hypothetical protein NQD34_000071 [Periophthalmus magnuspinnatus]
MLVLVTVTVVRGALDLDQYLLLLNHSTFKISTLHSFKRQRQTLNKNEPKIKSYSAERRFIFLWSWWICSEATPRMKNSVDLLIWSEIQSKLVVFSALFI